MRVEHIQSADAKARSAPSAWPVVVALAILFLGPLAAPLFQATAVPVVADTGALAHDLLSRYICPTPAKSYLLFGFPMAVCARCWGATIGLWIAWMLFRARNASPGARVLAAYLALAWPFWLLIAAGALLLWTFEINTWPGAPLPLLLLNGAHGGFWAGLLLGAWWGRINALTGSFQVASR